MSDTIVSAGYMVVYSEFADYDSYGWPMVWDEDPKAPDNAICCISKGNTRVAVFTSRQEARAAINTTYHFTKAYYPNHEDDRKQHRIVQAYKEAAQ